MNPLLEKIYKVIEIIEKERYIDRDATCAIETYHNYVAGQKPTDLAQKEWEPYVQGTFWASKEQHCWFRTQIKFSEPFIGKKVFFSISTGHQEGWDISNPQFLIYVNGELRQGLDVNHKNTLLTSCASKEEIYDIYLLGYSGIKDESVIFSACIKTVHEIMEDYYYNLSNLFWALTLLEETDFNYVRLLKTCLDSVQILDLRKLHSLAFYESLEKANQHLIDAYYTHVNEDVPKVVTIGHTHIDIAWMWTIDQTKEKVVRSFSTVLELMKLYPDYKFMSSQPLLYAFVKENEPELYERIKERINEGRWEVDGGMWVEADCNLPGGESLTRQLLYGTRFFKEEFGKDCATLWLPDVFGYSAALPQLIKKSGMSYMMTSKLDWNRYNRIPHDTFMWKGIDGTSVLTHLITTTNDVAYDGYINKRKTKQQTTYNGRLNANQVRGTYTRYQDRALSDETLQLFGFGDGGGGPTEAMLENYERLKYGLPGVPRVMMDEQKAFFSRLAEKTEHSPLLKTWYGELFLEFHQGTFTSMAENKRLNRIGEFLLQEAEWLYSITAHIGVSYPMEALTKLWKQLLVYQFHDIIPGSSIKAVYDESRLGYGQILSETRNLTELAKEAIYQELQLDEQHCLVFNQSTWEGFGFVRFSAASIDERCIDRSNADIQPVTGLKDCAGHIYPLIKSMSEDSYYAYVEGIPVKGYSVMTFVNEVPSEAETKDQSDIQLLSCLESRFYKMRLNEQMEIISLFDKEEQREIIKEGGRGNVLQLFIDRPSEFENWNIDATYKDSMYEINHVEHVRVVEDSPLIKAIEIKRCYENSVIVQTMILNNVNKRIDFETKVDWHEHNVLLKTAFEVDINSTEATFEIQYGNITRTTHDNTSWDEAKYEVCAHKWVDFSEAGYGVSLMNDCKYGHTIKDNTMSLTLIKCGTYPNEEADQGLHQFTYGLYGHNHTWREADTQMLAYELNVPLSVYYKSASDKICSFKSKNNLPDTVNVLGHEFSFITSDLDTIIIDTVKKAETKKGYIVRLYESANLRSKVRFKTHAPIRQMYLCDLMEQQTETAVFSHNTFELLIKGYEIVTIYLEF